MNRADVAHFAQLVSNEVIAANKYDLAVSSYVEKEDTREVIEISELNGRISEICNHQVAKRCAIDEIVADVDLSVTTEKADGAGWKTLGELFNMKAGKFISASQISPVSDEGHPYPCYGGNGIRGYVASYNHDGSYDESADRGRSAARRTRYGPLLCDGTCRGHVAERG